MRERAEAFLPLGCRPRTAGVERATAGAAALTMKLKLHKIDVFKKVDPELLRGTNLGAVVSVLGIAIILGLFFFEVSDFLTNDFVSTVVMDPRITDTGDELRINFNITLERLACPYVSLELHNSLGTHRTNITRNIIKMKVKTKGDVSHVVGVMSADEPKRILIDENAVVPDMPNSRPDVLTPDNFESYIARHDVVIVDFFAPWCVWCKRLHPVWEATAHDFASEFGSEGRRVGVAWVDCTDDKQVALCHSNHVSAFPTIVAFRGGDSHSHDYYHGDRTVAALKEFVRAELVKLRRPSLDDEHAEARLLIKAAEDADFADGDGKHVPAWEGCRIEGFVLTPKVPSTLVFQAVMPSHSMDPARINVTHEIHHLSFGLPFSKQELKILPAEVAAAMHRLDGQEFATQAANQTVEHYLNLVGTSFSYLHYGTLATYKYTAHSAAFHGDTLLPTVRVHYDLSPMHVSIVEKRKPVYRFVTNLFAIIGGCFTVFGLIDSMLDSAHQVVKKKISLGKQT